MAGSSLDAWTRMTGAAALFQRVEDRSLCCGQVGVLVNELVRHIRAKTGRPDQTMNVAAPLRFQLFGR